MHLNILWTRSSWKSSQQFGRQQWLRYLGWFVLMQAVVYCLLAIGYLPYIEVSHPYSIFYVLVAYITHFGVGAILTGLLAIPVIVLLPYWALILVITAIAMIATNAILIMDFTVYSLYRFHLSGFIWDLATGPAAQDIFDVSTATLLTFTSVIIGCLILTIFAQSVAVALATQTTFRHWGRYFIGIWLLSLLSSQSIHVWSEAHYDSEITGVTRHLPWYYPATNKRMMERMGWIDPKSIRSERLHINEMADNDLLYPVNPLECSTTGTPKNVLIITIDAMRADVFTNEIMPSVHSLTTHKNAQLFSNHYSGGNVTKSGLFSLFYGLPASYWNGFASAGRGAEWIRQHQEEEYQMGVFTSSSLLSPAFDRTIFASLPSLRLRSDGDRPSVRDSNSVNDLNDFLKNRSQSKPYFGFLFLDSAHGYDVPAGFEKFLPQWDSVDHAKLNNDFDPEPYFNRYKNSLYFLDTLLGKLFSEMEARGDFENTIILFTSDHGEEFNDLKKNYWGHGSNFSQYQTKVPLFILWPGKPRQEFMHRTSHFDVAPTMMSKVLGCTNPMKDYSVGGNLFDSKNHPRWLLMYSYYNYGVVTDNRIISTYPTGGYEIRDQLYNTIENATLDSQIGLEFLQQVSRFYE